MTEDQLLSDQAAGTEAHPRIEGIGVNPLDRRRTDVAVDVTPCLEPVTVEMVIVGPRGDELCSAVVVQSRDCTLDKVLHLHQDAEPGEHTLHVGLFVKDRLVHHSARVFVYPRPDTEAGR